mmetsp:Transcript_21631/g.31485  ORF Transcript_21631/g.31485 Transcript_21631/m.31485 type:complete len:339 (+) Transcript_21631:86-1102(+)
MTPSCDVIVNYLPLDVNDEQLHEMFNSYGKIVKANVAKSKSSGASLSYGFVTFSQKDEAEAAIAALNGMKMGSKSIKVSFAKPKLGDIQNRKLFVRCLPLSYTEDKITDLFAKFGEIIECRALMESDKVTPRGSAFVEFKNATDCEAALSALHNSVPPGAIGHIQVYYARPPPGSNQGSDTGRSYSHPTDRSQWSPPSTMSPTSPRGGVLTSAKVPYGSCLTPFPLPSPIAPRFSFPVSPVSREQQYANNIQEVQVRVNGIPPFVTLKDFLALFAPYGHVVSVGLDHALNPPGIMSFGSGHLRIVISPEKVQEMVCNIHNCVVFEGCPPLQLMILATF